MDKIVKRKPLLSQVGPGGMVAALRVVAAARWASTPIRRQVRQARKEGRLIDLTYGHACQWVLFLDSGHLVLATETIEVTVIDENLLEEYYAYRNAVDGTLGIS